MDMDQDVVMLDHANQMSVAAADCPRRTYNTNYVVFDYSWRNTTVALKDVSCHINIIWKVARKLDGFSTSIQFINNNERFCGSYIGTVVPSSCDLDAIFVTATPSTSRD